MAYRMGVFERIFKNLRNSLFAVKVRKDRFIGSDKFGNMYFEKESDKVHNLRASRYIKQDDPQNVEIPDIPVEWEAWLRGRRKDPPTEEEIEHNYVKMIETKRKAEELERKYSGGKLAESPSTAQAVAKDIEPSQETNQFPQYKEYENMPGQKYNKWNNKVK